MKRNPTASALFPKVKRNRERGSSNSCGGTQRPGLHGHGQRTAATVAKEDREDGRILVRVQWMDTTECSPSTKVPMGWGQVSQVDGADVAGREVVRAGV